MPKESPFRWVYGTFNTHYPHSPSSAKWPNTKFSYKLTDSHNKRENECYTFLIREIKLLGKQLFNRTYNLIFSFVINIF